MFRFCILTFLLGCLATAQERRRAPTQLLEEATAHYQAHRPAEAVRLFREYLATAPDRADVRVYLGAALLNLNELGAALEEARRAIAIAPNSSKAYVLSGRIYAEQQQWQIAQEFFAEALAIDDSDRDAWYFSGRAFYQAGWFDRAIRALLRAGSDGRVYENLGLAYEAAGRLSEADHAFRRAVQLSKNAYRPHLAYGVFLFKQNRLSESLALLKEAARLEPNSVETRFELGRALYQAGQFKEAISVLPHLVPPNQCRIHNLRGRILTRLGHADKAQLEFDAFRTCAGNGSELQR